MDEVTREGVRDIAQREIRDARDEIVQAAVTAVEEMLSSNLRLELTLDRDDRRVCAKVFLGGMFLASDYVYLPE